MGFDFIPEEVEQFAIAVLATVVAFGAQWLFALGTIPAIVLWFCCMVAGILGSAWLAKRRHKDSPAAAMFNALIALDGTINNQPADDEWVTEALRLADMYAMYYDNHTSVAEGEEQARVARAALAAHLASRGG